MYGTEEVLEVMVELSCRVLIRSKKLKRTLLLYGCALRFVSLMTCRVIIVSSVHQEKNYEDNFLLAVCSLLKAPL